MGSMHIRVKKNVKILQSIQSKDYFIVLDVENPGFAVINGVVKRALEHCENGYISMEKLMETALREGLISSVEECEALKSVLEELVETGFIEVDGYQPSREYECGTSYDVWPPPDEVYIHITNRCNLRCINLL